MTNMANVGSVFREGACGGPGKFTMTVDSTTIDSLKRKDIDLQKEIDKLKDSLQVSISSKISDLEECCEENRKKNESQDSQINEINANISALKGWNVRQDQKLDSLNKNVIVDTTYNNFQEWFENVYMKNPDKFNWKPGDVYINNNPSNLAINGTFINTGDITVNHPIDAWIELTYTSPADKLTILGIDPIKVDHPNQHERVVSMDPDKLGKMISELPRLDLSKTEIKLGDVFTTPIYKDDARFELNITVEGDTFLNNLNVTGLANFGDVVMNSLKVNDITTNVNFHQDVEIQENLHVHNHTTTNYLTVEKAAKIEDLDLDNELRINTKRYPCSGHYNDIIKSFNNGAGAPDSDYVAVNQTLFQPSFAKFVITSATEKYGDRTRLQNGLSIEWNPSEDGEYRSRLIALGGNMQGKSILNQKFAGTIGDLVPMGYNTPDIFRLADTNIIVIANSGVYDINYIYNISQSRNVRANRAGLALVRMGPQVGGIASINGATDLEIEDLVDNKWEGSGNGDGMHSNLGPIPYAREHQDTTYSGSDYTYKNNDGDLKRITGHMGMSIQTWSASGSTLVEIPCGEIMCLVPYIKPSIAGGSDRESLKNQYPEWTNKAWLATKDGKRNSGAFSQINIKKVANSTTQSTANGRPIV